MFSHNPLSVLRIACYSSITQLTPTQVSRTGSRAPLPGSLSLFPTSLWCPLWTLASPLSQPYHTIWSSLFICLFSHLEVKAHFWITTACPVPSTEPGTEKFLPNRWKAVWVRMVVRECSPQIHCTQTSVRSGHLGQVAKAWAKLASSSPFPTHYPIILCAGGILFSQIKSLHISISVSMSPPPGSLSWCPSGWARPPPVFSGSLSLDIGHLSDEKVLS